MKNNSTLLLMLIILLIIPVKNINAQWDIAGKITSNTINSVYYLNGNNVWAVGDNAIILKYNGSNWLKQDLPFITSSNLRSVYFLNDTLGWAVGETGLILKYSGSKWNVENISGSNGFYSVYFVDETHGWAVGEGCIYFYDGIKWTSVTPDLGYFSYKSVYFVDASHGWVATSNGSILKYSGSTWTIEASNLSNYPSTLCMTSATDGWAAGAGAIYRYNGTSWSSVPFPSGLSGNQIYSISMVNASLGYMAGSNCVLKFNGTDWQKDTTVDYSMYGEYLAVDLNSDGSDGFVSGRDGLIFRYSDGKWTSNQSYDNKYYYSLDFVDKNHGWFTKNESIMKYSYGKIVKDSIKGYSSYLASINMLDTLHGMAVGSSSQYLKYNGKYWESLNFSKEYKWYNLYDVQMIDTSSGWAVGYNGLILKYDGNSWIEQPKITSKALNSVCFTDSLHGWIVGDSGAILKYANKKWTVVNIGITENLKSVAFSDSSNGWAVGYSEVILHYNGKSWNVFKRGDYQWYVYNSVKYTSNKWYITGYNKLLTFNGSAWIDCDLEIGGWNSFLDIDFGDTDNGWMITYQNIYSTKNGGRKDYTGIKSISIAGRVDYPNVWSFDTVMVLHDISMNRYLTIKPLTTNGVKVIFKDKYNFSAGNGFSALGYRKFRLLPLNLAEGTVGKSSIIIIPPKVTEIYPVIFKALDSTGGKGWGSFYANPDWNDPLDTIRLSYCYFYASRDYYTVSLNNAGVVMNNCLFQENNGMVSLRGVKSGYINNCKFENTKNYSPGLEISNSSNLSVYGNLFKNNENGVTVYENSSAIVFDRNTFVSNRSSGLQINNSTVTIKNSNICNNNNGGLALTDSRVDIYNSIIANNQTYGPGGGISANNSVLNVINSDIVKNKSNSSGGIYYYFSNGDVYNSIIWNNEASSDTNQIGLYNYGSKPNFFYCDIEGGTAAFTKEGAFTYDGKYLNNVTIQPSFVSPSAGAGKNFDGTLANWRLKDTSACVNKGTQMIGNFDFPDYDLDNKKRVLNGAVDLGAYETSLQSFTAPCSVINTATVWAADTVKISCNVLISPSGSLKIMPGTRVKFLGPYKITVRGSLYAVGTSADSIRFTISDTSNFFTNDTSKGWRGIEFDNYAGDMDYSDSSIFRFCKFEYAKYVSNSFDINRGFYGIIRAVNFKKIEVSNSLFINNIVTNPQYYQAGIIFLSRSGIKLSDNKFLNNQGSITAFSMSEISFTNNIVTYNKYLKEYGSLIYINGCEARISNNIVANNSVISGPTINFASSNGLINNNVLANNSSDSASYYGTIEANSSNVIIANNTVVNNFNYGMYVFNSKVKVINNLIWGNFYGFGLSSPGIGSMVSNCDIDNYYGNNEYFINMLSDTPRFVVPSAGIGKTYNGYKADWRLTQFSPCINKGSSDTSGLKLSALDISGKKRVNGERIDIGAYEDQGSRLYITSQPVNIIACSGDSVEFSLETSDTAFLQWQKNGIDIPGAKSKKYKIKSAGSDDEANYSCNATNAYGTVQTNNVYLSIRTAPRIINNPEDAFIGKSRKAVLSIEATGSEPMVYQWYKDNVSLTNQNFAVLKFDNIAINDEAKYFCRLTNTCGEAITDTVSITIVPQICMVSVANDSNHNLVIWEKNSKQIFDHYNIYREGTVSGYYQKIGELPFNSSNIFEDTLVNPKSQAFLYKLTGSYADGTETDLDYCSPHKTIHLLITEGVPQGYQLDWDEYIGFPYGTYNIYKIVGGSDTSLVHSMASTTRTWTDINETEDTVYYFVSVQKSDGCYPQGGRLTKAGGDIFDQSVSNIEDNRLRAGTGVTKVSTDELHLVGYPNPYKEFANIKYSLDKPAKVTLELCNVLGKTISVLMSRYEGSGNHKFILDSKKLQLTDGVYTLKLMAGNKVAIIKLIQTK